MRKKVAQYLFLILPFLSCSSEVSTNQDLPKVLNDVVLDHGNSLLWKVEGEGIASSYLYGTMHMINEEFYHFSDNLTSKVAAADAIIMEVGGIPNPITVFEMMSIDSGRVNHYFTKKQFVTLLQFMDEKLGVSPQEFDRTYGGMKPFLILQTITQGYFEATAKSHDLTIMGIASENNKPIIGLETISQQLGFFDEIPKDKMAEMVIESIEKYEKEVKNTRKLMELYAAEKVDKLIPLLEKQSPEFMEFADLFLYNRNTSWIPKLQVEMKDKSCFIAVGAGHLFGEKGIIDLLEKQGLTVTPISSK